MKTLKSRGVMGSAVTLAVLVGIFFAVRSTGANANGIPTAEVKRGEFVDWLQIRGEIKATKSKVLNAPSNAGDLQIIKLAKTGSQVKKDDIIVQFDTTMLQRTLEQKQSDLKTADAEIERQRAQGHMTEEQNLTDSLSAKYNVEKARLDANKQEILSEIDGEKTKLAVSDSEKKLEETQTRLKSGKDGVDAQVEIQKKKREKALFDVKLAETQMSMMTLHAPADGMVTLLPNYRGVNWGAAAPDFKEGDRAWPGAAVAEIPDLSSIRFETRVDESDRGSLRAGQTALVRIDAVPDKEFTATIREISTLAKLDFSGWPPAKNFTVDIDIGNNDPRIRPGMGANSRVAISRIPDSILVPTEAVFQKNGRSVVFVQKGSHFEERVVQIGKRSTSESQVINGIQPGERVALKNPDEVAAQ